MPFYANKMRHPGKWTKIRAAEVETETKAESEEDSMLSLSDVRFVSPRPSELLCLVFATL